MFWPGTASLSRLRGRGPAFFCQEPGSDPKRPVLAAELREGQLDYQNVRNKFDLKQGARGRGQVGQVAVVKTVLGSHMLGFSVRHPF